MQLANAPKYSIEKPNPISINSPLLDSLAGWVGQLKIDEHRSFFIFNKKSLIVLGWRGNVHHTVTLSKNHPTMILDGGIIKTKTFKQKPLFYTFDILEYEGKKIDLMYKERFEWLNKIKPQTFVVPENTTNFREEYADLLGKKSGMIERFAKEAGISLAVAYEVCEGSVIKNENGKLRYPRNVYHSPNQLKLKLPGR